MNIAFGKKDYLTKKINLVMDPVIELSKFYKTKKEKSNLIGIGVIHPKYISENNIKYPNEYYYKLFSVIIKQLELRNCNWELFCNGNINDYEFARKICNYLNIPEKKIAVRPETPNQLIDEIIKYELVLSFRLHSHIIATSFLIPTIGFCWDEKIKHFANSIDRDEYFLEINDDLTNNIIIAIDKVFSVEYRLKIRNKYSSLFLMENKFGE